MSCSACWPRAFTCARSDQATSPGRTCCWEWFAASDLIGPSGLVNDGLSAAGKNNGGTTWTYNQGVVLGWLADLHAATSDRSYLSTGLVTAGAALRSLTFDGILTELGRGAPSGDLVQFKGIFARSLRAFAAVATVPGYRRVHAGERLVRVGPGAERCRTSSATAGRARSTAPTPAASPSALDLLNSAIGIAAGPDYH